MSNVLVVYKNRTNIVTVSMGFDVSEEVITSEIRTEPEQDSSLIAIWEVEFETDGIDGELVLTLSKEDADVEVRRGWMDLKRDQGDGIILPVFDRPLEVDFRGTVTV